MTGWYRLYSYEKNV